jgi:peptidoglycan-N-acetylglucosamine deacetylase
MTTLARSAVPVVVFTLLTACALKRSEPPANPSTRSLPDPVELAVTVDDLPRHGPDIPSRPPSAIAESMLRTFQKHKLPSVYGFINGRKLEAHPEDRAVLEAWRAAGHPLGNHTWAHLDADKIPVAEFLADIDRNEPLLRELPAPGAVPSAWKVFRYPFLHEGPDLTTRDAIRSHLSGHGYRIAQVTVDPWDWAYNGAYARCLARGDAAALEAVKATLLAEARAALRFSAVQARLLFGRPIKQILLLHLSPATADVLDDMLTAYERAGVRFISLDEALQDEVYRIDPRVPETWTFLSQIAEQRGALWPPHPLPPSKLLEAVCRDPAPGLGSGPR